MFEDPGPRTTPTAAHYQDLTFEVSYEFATLSQYSGVNRNLMKPDYDQIDPNKLPSIPNRKRRKSSLMGQKKKAKKSDAFTKYIYFCLDESTYYRKMNWNRTAVSV